jgi:cation:H+ antiporter
MEPWSLPFSGVAFAVASLATVLGGIRLAKSWDLLSDRTGMGEALFGALFFGAIISASGIVMSAVAALGDQPICFTPGRTSSARRLRSRI